MARLFSSGALANSGFEYCPRDLQAARAVGRRLRVVPSATYARRDARSTPYGGIELRIPAALTPAGFDEFNRPYIERLTAWGVMVDGLNPVARTNVAPASSPIAEPSMYGFYYTVPAVGAARPAFVLAGVPEVASREGGKREVVAAGDVSLEGLRRKTACIMEALGGLLGEMSFLSAFSKQTVPLIRLVEGLGVRATRISVRPSSTCSRVRHHAHEPNLRQVHLIQAELFDEVHEHGFRVLAGDLGENVTTSGLDLLALPVDTVLLLGDTAEVRVTGLRNPCVQIDRFQPGLLEQVVHRDEDGAVVRRAGVMAVVRRGGEVRPGDPVTVVLPDGPHRPLEPGLGADGTS